MSKVTAIAGRTRIRELESKASRTINVETQLGQTKALAALLAKMAEFPNAISAETIGWVGSLFTDQLARVELAIERESSEPSLTGLSKEIDEIRQRSMEAFKEALNEGFGS